MQGGESYIEGHSGMTNHWYKSWKAGLVLVAVLLAAMAVPALGASNKDSLDLAKVLSHMDKSSKHLKTLSANLEYTKVTVIVNDHSTDSGKIYFRNDRSPDFLIDFREPAKKVILFKNDKAELYNPMINQITEYNLSKHASLIQEFLLLGFGTDSKEMERVYKVRYLKEEQLGGDTTAVLELTPRAESLAAQLSKVQLWVSEESWLPVQQKFFQPDGDYAIARYSSVEVNRYLPSSTFKIRAPKNVRRVKMP